MYFGIEGIGVLGAATELSHTQRSASTTEDGRTMAEVFADVAASVEAVTSDEMSVKEYKDYILERISNLPIDASQAMASHAVHISDEAFEAMRQDTDYEEWVIDQLRQNFAFVDPWSGICGGSYHVHTFGATKEAYHGESWFPGYNGGMGGALFADRSSGSQWLRETPKRRPSSDIDLSARLRMERMLRKKALEHMDMQSALLEQASRHRQAVEEMNRSGKKAAVSASPVPQFHGVSAAFLLAMLGGGSAM